MINIYLLAKLISIYLFIIFELSIQSFSFFWSEFLTGNQSYTMLSKERRISDSLLARSRSTKF